MRAALGTVLELEVAVGYGRRRARARVVKRPFYNPARKTAVGSAAGGHG